MRHLGPTLIVFIAAGMPLTAKNVSAPRPSPGAVMKAPTKLTAHAATLEKRPASTATPEVVLTSDLSRAAKAARIASQPGGAVAAQVRSVSQARTPVAPMASTGVAHGIPTTAPMAAASGTRTLPRLSHGSGSGTRGLELTPALTDASPAEADPSISGQRLARVTAYWADEGDYYTGRGLSATGVRLHDGHCAVDPTVIPYGSVVNIKGVGSFLAVDTGSAVIHRTAAREGGTTPAQRHAIVVDLYFENPRDGERFAAGAAKYVPITWWTPDSTGTAAREARSLFAEEDWAKIQGKQL